VSPEAFIARWREPLATRATIVFEHGPRDGSRDNFCDIANGFVERCGYTSIGFNWEMLDPNGAAYEPRSARAVIADAFSRDMALPQTEWLGQERAQDCAEDFLSMFTGTERTIASNRLGDFWNPLTRAQIEWAFVGFDDARIALLLAMSEG